jgi:hypothetical protein
MYSCCVRIPSPKSPKPKRSWWRRMVHREPEDGARSSIGDRQSAARGAVRTKGHTTQLGGIEGSEYH